jgi:hypothetical protein
VPNPPCSKGLQNAKHKRGEIVQNRAAPHVGTALFNTPLNGFDAAPFSLAVDVMPGDTIDFAAGPSTDGNPDFDSTGFNVTITPEL